MVLKKLRTCATGWFSLLIVLTLTACGDPVTTITPITPAALPHTIMPSDTVTPVPPTNTVLPPSETALPATETSTPTSKPSDTPIFSPTACINKARFVGETVLDDTSFQVSTIFKKTWTLENNGTCIWTTGYSLVFVSGTFMGSGAQSSLLNKAVKPGDQITLEVDLQAPSLQGTYTANYMLADEGGVKFGVGSSGMIPFFVRIASQICNYRAALLEETHPPSTKVWVGELFTKQWTIKNTGGCTLLTTHHPWINDGGFGSPPSGPSDGQPGPNLLPGEAADLEVYVIAPMTTGRQRAEFLVGFSTDSSLKFDGKIGIGPDGITPLTIEVVTVEPPANLSALGAPAIFDTFDKNEGLWSLEKASIQNQASFTIAGGSLEMTVTQGFEHYTVRTGTERRGQAHEAVFVTDSGCTGKNAYGLLFGLLYSPLHDLHYNGHLIRITCDGQYSVEYLGWNYRQGVDKFVLVPLTSTAAIKVGPNQTNRLSVIAAGGRMHVFINGVKIVELEQAIKFRATQYQNGTVAAQFDLNVSQMTWNDRPYVWSGPLGLFIDGEDSSHTVRVEEYKFWNLDDLLK